MAIVMEIESVIIDARDFVLDKGGHLLPETETNALMP